MTELPNEHLIARARAGDSRAFGELIRLWDADLRGVAWAVCRSSIDTDDIMQKAYEKAFRSIDSFDGRSSLKTWMWSISHRTALDHIRYEQRREHQPEASAAHLPTTANVADETVDRLELAAVMESLDPVTRSLLILTAGKGLTVDEAAVVTNLPRGTAAARIRRARARLQRWDHA